MKYICGVEGGSTSSKIVLLDETGKLLSTLIGQATNPILLGEQICFQNIKEMIDEAKRLAKLDPNTVIDSIGLAISGCMSFEDGKRLSDKFISIYPSLVRNCIFTNDLVGSLYASNRKFGIVIISGTGSNSMLLLPNGTSYTCGGWGHLFGDEGSGYWIAYRAYKTILDDNDRYECSQYDLSRMRQVILKHFNIENERDIEKFYRLNDKKGFASLSKELYAETCRFKDDAIDLVFEEAGILLARKVIALLSRANITDFNDDYIHIVCVGSVFNAWDKLSTGFNSKLKEIYKDIKYKIITTGNSVLGAAKLAADQISLPEVILFKDEGTILYTSE